jgi:hypothetical protein
MLQSWTFAPKPSLEASSSRNDRCTVCGYGDGGDARGPCYLSEREALSYMADRLRRTAAFE